MYDRELVYFKKIVDAMKAIVVNILWPDFFESVFVPIRVLRSLLVSLPSFIGALFYKDCE